MGTNLKDKMELKEKEIELKKIELELASQPGKAFGFTAKEWVEIAMTGGGCIWSLPIMALLVAVIFDPTLVEVYDQFIVGFVGVAAGFYLGRKIK